MKMTETEQTDPITETTIDQELIKDVKDEIAKLDVFVCGSCHDVFHYVEHFQEHKKDGICIGVSTLHDETTADQKTQVWGFLLWKNAKFKKNEGDDENVKKSSWSIYQEWCNLELSQKDAWIAAGQSILISYKIATAKAPETAAISCQTSPIKIVDEDGDMHKFDSSADAMETESETDSEEDIEKELAEMEGLPRPRKKKKMKSNNVKNMQLSKDVNKDPACKTALRTTDDKKEECTIEKIISRRYNRGKKIFEYYIKWENMEHELNTWEPASHIEGCKLLVEEFEKNLQILKAQKLQQKQIISKKLAQTKLLEESAQLTQEGRPQRTSKQKALNQVKVWCGNISDADDAMGKRAFSDSDSSDSLEKKMKMEADSSDSDYDRPPVTIKKIKQNILNGTGKKPLPDNVLVPDEQGIIRINQKQLPALSSGVYVMSKTAGIIKLDSNTSKIATSGGHAVIKVAPKMGQASIKVIKKDAGTTNGSKLPLITSKVKPPTRVYASKAIKRNFPLKKPENIMPGKIFEDEDEESDGLEELEFPTNLPLPTPESPPREFSLDPQTGKLAGQDYPEEMKMEEQNDGTATLENLVKMTAEEMLDSDGKETELTDKAQMETQNENQVENIESMKDDVLQEVQKSRESESVCKKEVIDDGTTINTSSILSKALSSANIESNDTVVQKKSVSTPSTIKQKSLVNKSVLNRNAPQQSQPQTIITRITPGTSRNRAAVQKSVTSPVVNRKVIRQTYVNKNAAARKLPTSTPTTATATYFVQSQTPEVVRTNAQPTILNTKQTLPTSTAVINMPLLTESEQENATVAVQMQENEPDQVMQQMENTDLNTFSLTDESPLLITGEDGTIYQVAGQNEEGQTILITQGADGQQQCLLVASENTSELNQAINASVVNAEPEESVAVKEETENAEDSQVVAQIVDAQPPSPGGTRKVVLMLPDGNLMMTEVTAEQYAALELDK